MTNEFKLGDTTREKMIYTKERLLAPLLPGMEAPPHPRRLGPDEQTYFLGLPKTGTPDTRTPSVPVGEGR
nr:NADH-quinone oxidoreductase subunit I [Micropruina sp.]